MSYQPTEPDERVKATTLQILEQMELLRAGTDSALEGADYGEQDPAILIAQLFTKLDLDVPADIESSHVETKTVGGAKTSDSDLVSFANIHTSVLFGTRSCTTVTTRRSTSNLRLEFVTNQQRSPFKWANMDVIFSTGLWVQPSPYNELYPFPADPQSAQKWSVSSIEANFQSVFYASHCSVESEIQERLCKIEKLRQLCPANHPGLIIEMWEIALMYWHKEKYPKAEYWWRQLARCPLSPATHAVVISSRLFLSSVLWTQRKLKEARSEHQIVHQLVLSSSVVYEILIEGSLSIGGGIAESLDENKDSESWFRQLAQLTLTTHGPRFEGTISSLRHLAEAMLSQRRYSESEELLWIMVDLAKTSLKSTDRATTKLACSLARLMFKQGRFEDAENLWRMSLEIAQTRWGSEDSIALKAETGLARVLNSQGRLAESETLLRRNVEKLVRVRGEDSLSASTTMECLGSLLMQDGRYADAAIWWEKCTKIRLLRLGPTDDKAFKTFSVLRECYLQLGRYSEALKLGQEWLEAVKKASGLSHRYVSQLQSWLDTILVGKLPNFQSDVTMQLF
jgi:tetratricopeptide (TPR) repeat protein